MEPHFLLRIPGGKTHQLRGSSDENLRHRKCTHTHEARGVLGSGSPLWDPGRFWMKCLPCSHHCLVWPWSCREKLRNISGGPHLEIPVYPVGSSSGKPCRNGAHQGRDWPITSQGALLELSPLWQFWCPQKKGEFCGLRFSYKVLSYFLVSVLGIVMQIDRGPFYR